MEIFLFSILTGLFFFFMWASFKGSLSFGMAGGILLLIIWSLIITTGLQAPYGVTNVINTDANVSTTYQNFTEIYHTIPTLEKSGMTVFILCIGLMIVIMNGFSIGKKRRV